MDHTSDFNAIPIFDLNQLSSTNISEHNRFIHRLRSVCHHVGFFYIKNHGMSLVAMENMLHLTKLFFNLPQEEKDAIAIARSPQFRGYGKLGAEITEGEPDFKETLDLGFESQATLVSADKPYLILRGPNQWPTSSAMVELKWKEHVLDYISTLQKIGEKLIGAMSLALGLPEDFLRNQFCANTEDAYAMLRLLKYPPGRSQDGQELKLGVGPHVDSGCLIILLQDEVGGLQVQNCEGQWIDAPPIPGTFVVNIGRMLQIWSDNFFLATPHRVINYSQNMRHSVPFFFEPNLSTVVTPLAIAPELLSNMQRPRAEPKTRIVYGEYMLNVYQRSFPQTKMEKNVNT